MYIVVLHFDFTTTALHRKHKRPNYQRSRRFTSRRGWDHLRCGDCESYCTLIQSLRKQRADEDHINKAREAYVDHIARQFEHRQVAYYIAQYLKLLYQVL
jgi:hypothetical protein